MPEKFELNGELFLRSVFLGLYGETSVKIGEALSRRSRVVRTFTTSIALSMSSIASIAGLLEGDAEIVVAITGAYSV